MAFDIENTTPINDPEPDLSMVTNYPDSDLQVPPDNTRKVALFEGRDEFNRLQPLLGTAEPATDAEGNPIFWPNTGAYITAGLAGLQMEGTIAWHSPTTENPVLNTVEEVGFELAVA